MKVNKVNNGGGRSDQRNFQGQDHNSGAGQSHTPVKKALGGPSQTNGQFSTHEQSNALNTYNQTGPEDSDSKKEIEELYNEEVEILSNEIDLDELQEFEEYTMRKYPDAIFKGLIVKGKR